ncbi:tRNA1(Val) (adenine(37)-N6)-methyltransferase [Bosea sp. (in: a-proteobacteria)]|jgi:tRNA1(Val) A37 N6-methylase TrmN6|uniref:tRNA1(Val) (adenine(37)-N6)-methyltransferase n=1 Tax=Bosea sp. (in: a-proteobacteria) TaxID=1871050 RepID=UPI003F6FC412
MSDAETALGAIVEDRLLDGRLTLRQPGKGHRAGSDAILLAAGLPDLDAGPLADFGAGVGTVGLAAAMLRPALAVTLIERHPGLAALAGENIVLNRLEDRARVVTADVGALAQAGLASASFACVAMNPPFFAGEAVKASPVANRRAAHVADGPLDAWLKAARRLLKPGGQVAVIHRAEALPAILAGLATGFGGAVIRPVHASADRPAIRVIVTAELNSRKPAALLPAFVLNGPDGRFTELSEAVHRGRALLP